MAPVPFSGPEYGRWQQGVATLNAAKPEGKSIFGPALLIGAAEERAAWVEQAC